MTSFFPADYDRQASFTCTNCGIYANVRGKLMTALLREQAERCRDEGHNIATDNLAGLAARNAE